MCTRKIKNYYKLMSCITLTIMLAMLIGLIVLVVDQFKNDASWWPITSTFLNMLAVLVMGSGLANLFYSHALLLEHRPCDHDID